MTELILTATAALAVAAVGAAWHFRRKGGQARRRAELLREHADRLTLQLVAAEQCVQHLTTTVIPAAAAAKDGRGAAGPEGGLLVPAQLEGTPLAERLRAVPGSVAAAVEDVRAQERTAAGQAAARTADHVRQDTELRIAQVRHESVGVARAAVRGFANNVVARSARLGRAVSHGVRRHISDEAYATLVEIDHLAQQMLLTASGYSVLAGDKLSRRWPATTLTDIVRAAMGRIEGYERIKHPEMGSVVVEGRAVEAIVHALAVLLDNALRYSPPAASVHVSLEQGHHACFLIVDDAGLRMDDERLLWASDVMSGEQRDDITRLGAHPQTGLRVASLLAESYGFRVELTAPNIYQGTRAMVVLPKNLLADPATTHPATTPAAVPGAIRAAPAAAVPAAVPGAQPGAVPTAVPAAVPGAVPAAVPGAVTAQPAAVPGAKPAAQPGPVTAQPAAEPTATPAAATGAPTGRGLAPSTPAATPTAVPAAQPDATPAPASAAATGVAPVGADFAPSALVAEPAPPAPDAEPAVALAAEPPRPDSGSESVPEHGPREHGPREHRSGERWPREHGPEGGSPAPHPAGEPTPAPEPAAAPATTTASGLTVRRRSTAPAPARRPAASDDTEPGRPTVAAAWAAGTRLGRQGEAGPADTGADATHTAGRDAAHDEGH
ncbi:sensor histidine kinase [Streptomyces sp. AC512_CC834]|uniref:ATP-binding protein n=1 Tax=Streptomyces sp. AC512_CC834 TaxID=2823691 RepID=UPI0020B7885B|nr:ATP-binding protein [Streptomyces sp. AC512_CC834]